MKQIVLLFFFIVLTSSAFSQTSFNDRLKLNLESEKIDIQVYPNPVTDYLKVSDNASVERVKIFNLVGKAVKNYDYLRGRERVYVFKYNLLSNHRNI